MVVNNCEFAVIFTVPIFYLLFFTPFNAYKSITLKLLLKYEWIVLADFSLSFSFRKFGSNKLCASVGTQTSSLRPSQMSSRGWTEIN